MQAKAYAKSDGNQILNFTSLEDISWLMQIDGSGMQYYDDSDVLFSSSDVANLIFCTFLWLNILILIFTMLNVNKVYTWLEEQSKSWKDMYKASAGVLTLINLGAFIGDITSSLIFLSYHDNIYLIIKLVFVVMIIILELLVSCCSTSTLKHNKKKVARDFSCISPLSNHLVWTQARHRCYHICNSICHSSCPDTGHDYPSFIYRYFYDSFCIIFT